MMDGDEEVRHRDTSIIPGLNATAAATLPKTEQGSKAPSSTGNTSSIWSRMKSSFYASGGKAKQAEQEVTLGAADVTTIAANDDDKVVAEPKDDSQSFINKSEANLAKALRKAREEEEKWQITKLTDQTLLDNDNDNLASEADSLVGGTIIVPDGGELPVTDKGSVSPGLSFRASMADISLLEGEGATNEKQNTTGKCTQFYAEEKVEAKEASLRLPDDISLLGSTIESFVRDDPARVAYFDRKMPAEDGAAKVEGVSELRDANEDDADDKARNELAPIVGLGDRTASDNDDKTFGQAFADIGEQMFQSDAPEISSIVTATSTPKINAEGSAPAPTSGVADNANGRSKYHLCVLAFGVFCLALSTALSHYNFEEDIAPIPAPSAAVDVVPSPKAAVPVQETTTSDEPADADLTRNARTSCVVGGVEYAFGTPYYNSDGCNYCICGRRCTSENCNKTTDNDIIPSADSNANPAAATSSATEAAAEEALELGRVGAAPELLRSDAFALFAALASLLCCSLFSSLKKPTSKKTTRKGAQSNATTPSRKVERNEKVDIPGTPRPGVIMTPVTETPRPRRSRAFRKNHDEKDIFASTVKIEVRTGKGRWVEARRSGRILKYGSPMKVTKRE